MFLLDKCDKQRRDVVKPYKFFLLVHEEPRLEPVERQYPEPKLEEWTPKCGDAEKIPFLRHNDEDIQGPRNAPYEIRHLEPISVNRTSFGPSQRRTGDLIQPVPFAQDTLLPSI